MRHFKQKYELTVHAYLIQCRLRKARELIRCGESLVDASLHSGFYDQSKFTKYFKRAYGITPKKYLKSYAL